MPAATTRPARVRINVNDAWCEALFASPLQPSDSPTAGMAAEAANWTLRQLGVHGCAGRMAQEFGDHPGATALTRMRWALTAAASASGGSPAAPARTPAPGHSTVPCTARAPAPGHSTLPCPCHLSHRPEVPRHATRPLTGDRPRARISAPARAALNDARRDDSRIRREQARPPHRRDPGTSVTVASRTYAITRNPIESRQLTGACQT